MRTLILFGTKFQYSRKRRQDEEGKQSDKAAIRHLMLTFCPTTDAQHPTQDTETLDACIWKQKKKQTSSACSYVTAFVDIAGANIATKSKRINSCMFFNQQNSPE